MSVPTFLPTLSSGAHDPGEGQACVMEYVSLLAGEQWSDSPACTHPVLAAVARSVNDSMPDEHRHQLVPLIGRLFGTAETGTERECDLLNRRLAIWSARQVLHLTRPEDRQVCEAAIVASEGWCDGTVTDDELAAARAAAGAAARAAAGAAAGAAAWDAARDAAWAAARDAARDATRAAAWAAAWDAARVKFLTGLIDEYDRLTGRTEHRLLTDTDLRALAAAI